MKKSRISGLKHYVIYLASIAIIGVGVWSLYHFKSQSPKEVSHQMLATITKIDGNTIEVSATHILDANPARSDYQTPRIVTVNVDAKTKFVRTIILVSKQAILPNANKLDPSLYTKKDTPGALKDLYKNLPIIIKTTTDTLNSPTVTASEIDYSVSLQQK